jgi:hypothetical protein
VSEEGQRPERACDPHPFTGGAHVEPHPPAQPGSAGAETSVPAALVVEFSDQQKEPRGGGVEVCRQLRDLITEAVQVSDAFVGGNEIVSDRGNRHGRALPLLERLYTPSSAPRRRLRGARSPAEEWFDEAHPLDRARSTRYEPLKGPRKDTRAGHKIDRREPSSKKS